MTLERLKEALAHLRTLLEPHPWDSEVVQKYHADHMIIPGFIPLALLLVEHLKQEEGES